MSFPNVSQLVCKNRPAYIKLHRQQSQDKMYSWQNQDPKDVVVSESFYLNMSNCLPVKGAFSVASQITLHTHKSTKVLIDLVNFFLFTSASIGINNSCKVAHG